MLHYILFFSEPTSVDPPLIENVDARDVEVSWEAPMEPNGIVIEYNLYVNNVLFKNVSYI